MENLGGAGVFGIEMFVTSNGEILVNEIAPRVHNSGHRDTLQSSPSTSHNLNNILDCNTWIRSWRYKDFTSNNHV